MIVRDEAEFLPECLASIKAHVDEIVIVDTGSTDATREIAARAAFEAALAVLPDHLEARLGLIECLLEDGRYGEVLARIEPLLGEGPDAWLLAAAAADALGATDDVRALLARARALSSKGYLAPHRVARHIRLHVELAARASAPRVTPAQALL
jgi:glycosyltransferase involved in cell wall biosynthesis